MLTEPRDCSGQQHSLLQARNRDNPVSTFPASPAPRDGLVIQLWPINFQGKSSGDFWERFCFPDKKERYCWCQQLSAADLLLRETDSYLLSKGLLLRVKTVPNSGGFCDVLLRYPSGRPAVGNTTSWQPSSGSHLQELYSVEVSCLSQCQIRLAGGSHIQQHGGLRAKSLQFGIYEAL